MSEPSYSARELVRAAGFCILRASAGGVWERVDDHHRILWVGPDATELDLVEVAARYIEIPAQWRKLVDADRRRPRRRVAT